MPRGVTVDVGGAACWVLAYTPSSIMCVMETAPAGGRTLQVDLRWTGYGYGEAAPGNRPGTEASGVGTSVAGSWMTSDSIRLYGAAAAGSATVQPLGDEFAAPIEIHGVAPVRTAAHDAALSQHGNRTLQQEAADAVVRASGGVWATAAPGGGSRLLIWGRGFAAAPFDPRQAAGSNRVMLRARESGTSPMQGSNSSLLLGDGLVRGSALRPWRECAVVASSFRWVLCETPALRDDSAASAHLAGGEGVEVDVRVEARGPFNAHTGPMLRTSGVYTRYNGRT